MGWSVLDRIIGSFIVAFLAVLRWWYAVLASVAAITGVWWFAT
ncbi:MAG: hypothetical protein AAGD23_12225 [Pseudomonadota bacterium]